MPTRRQIATSLSIIYLLALTILASYAVHSSNKYSLPIPNSLSSLTLALPPIAGIIIETSNALATSLSLSPKYSKPVSRRTPMPPVLLPGTLSIMFLVVYCAVVATLAGTHISPIGGLNCRLREKWTELFRAKDADAIRRIQDAFECCGLANGRDMSWPFPGRGVGDGACVKRFEWTEGCLEGWRGEERVVSGIMLGVVVGVFVWLVVIVATPAIHPLALRDMLREEDSDEGERVGSRSRAIEPARYRDDPEEADSMRREINDLNSQSNLASIVEGGRIHPSALTDDGNRWRDSETR